MLALHEAVISNSYIPLAVSEGDVGSSHDIHAGEASAQQVVIDVHWPCRTMPHSRPYRVFFSSRCLFLLHSCPPSAAECSSARTVQCKEPREGGVRTPGRRPRGIEAWEPCVSGMQCTGRRAATAHIGARIGVTERWLVAQSIGRPRKFTVKDVDPANVTKLPAAKPPFPTVCL
jgi:hypothetical protein